MTGGSNHHEPNRNFEKSRIFFHNIADNDLQITESDPDFETTPWKAPKLKLEIFRLFSHFHNFREELNYLRLHFRADAKSTPSYLSGL